MKHTCWHNSVAPHSCSLCADISVNPTFDKIYMSSLNMSMLFVIFLFSFLAPNSIEASNCVAKNFRLQKSPTLKGAALNCSEAGSSWRGSLKTRQTRRGITLRWLDLINNPNCVDTISIYLDGELVKDQERPRPKQTKLEIKYAHTKCRSHSVLLTVEVYIKGKKACYKASSRLTHRVTLNETQHQECLRKVETEKEAKEREKQGIVNLRSSEQNVKIVTPTEAIPNRQHHSHKSFEETF